MTPAEKAAPNALTPSDPYGRGRGSPARAGRMADESEMKEHPMPKEEWGTKRVCPTTGKRFYDLNANPIVSPYTGEVVNIETGKARTMVADAEDAQSKKAKEPEAEEDGGLLIDEDDTEADLGDDVLDDDDDDDAVSLDELADVAGDDDD